MQTRLNEDQVIPKGYRSIRDLDNYYNHNYNTYTKNNIEKVRTRSPLFITSESSVTSPQSETSRFLDLVQQFQAAEGVADDVADNRRKTWHKLLQCGDRFLDKVCLECGYAETVALRCHMRCCPVCGGRIKDKNRFKVRKIVEAMKYRRFLTLSLKNVPEITQKHFKDCAKSFWMLRRYLSRLGFEFRTAVYAFECPYHAIGDDKIDKKTKQVIGKYTEKDYGYHLHMHILFDAEAELSKKIYLNKDNLRYLSSSIEKYHEPIHIDREKGKCYVLNDFLFSNDGFIAQNFLVDLWEEFSQSRSVWIQSIDYVLSEDEEKYLSLDEKKKIQEYNIRKAVNYICNYINKNESYKTLAPYVNFILASKHVKMLVVFGVDRDKIQKKQKIHSCRQCGSDQILYYKNPETHDYSIFESIIYYNKLIQQEMSKKTIATVDLLVELHNYLEKKGFEDIKTLQIMFNQPAKYFQGLIFSGHLMEIKPGIVKLA